MKKSSLKKKKALGSNPTKKEIVKTETDARTTIVVHSSEPQKLKEAIKTLSKSPKPQKVLQVRQKDINFAAQEMSKRGLSGTIENISRTQRKYIGVERIDPKTFRVMK